MTYRHLCETRSSLVWQTYIQKSSVCPPRAGNGYKRVGIALFNSLDPLKGGEKRSKLLSWDPKMATNLHYSFKRISWDCEEKYWEKRVLIQQKKVAGENRGTNKWMLHPFMRNFQGFPSRIKRRQHVNGPQSTNIANYNEVHKFRSTKKPHPLSSRGVGLTIKVPKIRSMIFVTVSDHYALCYDLAIRWQVGISESAFNGLFATISTYIINFIIFYLNFIQERSNFKRILKMINSDKKRRKLLYWGFFFFVHTS